MFKKLKAFTLIELLIVLLILGILASIATPAYLRYVHRARASEAVAVLGMIRQAEREYYAKHNNYRDVASGNLRNDPEAASNQGMDIDVKTTQYFSNSAYSVNTTQNGTSGTSTQFSDPPVVDFSIYVDGSLSANCSGTITDCAVRDEDAAKYRLEMDNSGRIFVSYNNATNWTGW